MAQHSLIDSAVLQACVTRVGHRIVTWLLFPGMSVTLLFFAGAWVVQLTRETFFLSLFWGPGLAFMAALGYRYFVPKGYRRYFYVVCATPAIVGVLLSIACVIAVLISGFPAS